MARIFDKRVIVLLLLLLFSFFLVTVPFAAAEAPEAKIVASETTVLVDENIQFDATTSIGGIIKYEWDFDGDGTVDSVDPTPIHSYTVAKKYVVTLTVTNATGVKDSVTLQITVEEPSWGDAALGFAVIFIIIGIIMITMEPLVPGFFIAIPGVFFLTSGLIGSFKPDAFYPWGIMIGIVAAIPVTFIVLMFYKRIGKIAPPTTTVGDSLIDKIGKITRETLPGNVTKGKVRIGSRVWSATSNKKLKIGTKVKVIESEGVHVVVEEIK